jgi:lactose/L-arabinose transport system substrate-binding protein
MKKKVWVVALLIFVTLFSACSGGSTDSTSNANTPPEKKPVEGKTTTSADKKLSGNIDVWLFTDNVIQDPIKAHMPDFNAKYPDVKVNIIPVNGVDVAAKLMTAISSGKGIPDVVHIGDTYFSIFARQGALHDVTDRLQPFIDKLVPWKLQLGNFDGKHYTIPYDGAMTVMYYRRDIFQQAGIKPEDLKTWDQYIEAGKKINQSTNGKVKMINIPVGTTGDKAGLNYIFEEMSHQLGGSIYVKGGKSTVNSPENVRTAEKLRKMIVSGITSNVQPWSPAEFAQWKDGSVATVINASWLKGSIEKGAPETSGKWGIMLPPAFEEGGNRISSYFSSQIAFPKSPKAEDNNLDAAWAFAEFFMMNKDIVPQLYQKGAPFPTLMTAYQDPGFKKPEKFWGDQVVGELLTANEPKVPIKQLVVNNWAIMVQTVLSPYLFEAMKECVDIQAILDKAKKSLEEQAQL